MTDRSGLTHEEQAAIAAHAQRVSAFVQLKRLVAGWRAELELQDKADRAVARAVGAIVALIVVAVWVYLLWQFIQTFLQPIPSAIHAARLILWYPAGMVALFPIFVFGFSYAIYEVLPSLEKPRVYALPVAIGLFLVGLILAPFLVWIVAS